MFRPPSLLATQIVPTVGYILGRHGLYVHAYLGLFLSQAVDANRPNRAIDGRGTCTLQDLRPCRPLLKDIDAPFHKNRGLPSMMATSKKGAMPLKP